MAAWFVPHGLAGEPIQALEGLRSVPRTVSLETSAEVDDLEVDFEDGKTLYLQAKKVRAMGRGTKSPFAEVVKQCVLAVRAGLSDGELVGMVVERADQNILDLRAALSDGGTPTVASWESTRRPRSRVFERSPSGCPPTRCRFWSGAHRARGLDEPRRCPSCSRRAWTPSRRIRNTQPPAPAAPQGGSLFPIAETQSPKPFTPCFKSQTPPLVQSVLVWQTCVQV